MNIVKDLSNQKNREDIKKKTLSTSDVAEFLDCSEKKARELMKSKGFPLLMVGKNMKVLKTSFDKWIEKQENKPIKERC